jgi:leucyl-tRNA synthetase
MLFERGLAYQAESLVNYDPVDKTVLANEQVDANGCSWRSGAKVEKLMLKQWFLRIKEFQEPLLNDLDALAEGGRWPEKVLAMQRNWIGKSEGFRLRFDIESPSGDAHFDAVDVFTTRADTIFGVQYLALSLTHPIVQKKAATNKKLRAFVERAKELSDDTKEGYLLPNIVARNPINKVRGLKDTASSVPVFVAPYVLDDYGSGAVMGVPGHDLRDHAFWRANVGNDPIKVVVTSKRGTSPPPLVPGNGEDKPMTYKGFVTSDIPRVRNLYSHHAMLKIPRLLRTARQDAEMTANWRLRDWLISRQRYWGTPIPIIHCDSCGAVPVPEQDLPVKLPNLPDRFFEGRKGNPLAEDEKWKSTTCPKCGSSAERETDTMDTFMDSSWYFFRFLDPHNNTALMDPRKANDGMPVDLYVGGVEHAILHLLYARFISKFLATTPTWPEGKLVNGEPFKRLITQGMVHGETFTDPENGRFLRPDEVDLSTPTKPFIKTSGLAPNISYEKMSKSKYNGVDPGTTIAKYGADATRAHMLFQAPVGDVLEWDEKKITGVQRWLQRVVRLSSAVWIPEGDFPPSGIPSNVDVLLLEILRTTSSEKVSILAAPPSHDSHREMTDEEMIALLLPQERNLWIQTQRTIASVTESYSQTYSLNTVISDLMTLTNTIQDAPETSAAMSFLKWYATAHLIRMMAPVAPGVAEEAWFLLTGSSGSHNIEIGHQTTAALKTVFATGFPTADLDIIPRLTQTMTCVVQVDGKRKFDVELGKSLDSATSNNKTSLSRWLLNELSTTEEGKAWLHPENGKVWQLSETKEPHPVYKFVPADWKVIVVNDGQLCNLVGPKKPKAKRSEGEPAAGTERPRVNVS